MSRCDVLFDDARNESCTSASYRRRRIEREFRTKVEPVLDRAQVVTVADCNYLSILYWCGSIAY